VVVASFIGWDRASYCMFDTPRVRRGPPMGGLVFGMVEI
jgi:hypothetical protein